MTDEKKTGGGAPPRDDEQEWEAALSEWDNKTFVPELAKDTASEKPAAPVVPVSKPLYRPPTAPATRAKPAAAPPPRPAAAAPAPPPPPPPPPPEPEAASEGVEEEEGGATVIAAIPRELLRLEEAGPKSSSRGGLGQMFAREEKRDASVEVSFEESVPRVAVAEPKPDPPSDVFTSAKPVVPSKPDASEAMPLRRPSKVDASEKVPDGAMFDPFAEPEPRSAQSTRPAESEIDDLLAAAPASSAPDTRKADAAAEALSALEQAKGPALLAPDARTYDPNEETMVGKEADLARARDAIAARRASAAAAPAPSRTWPDEKPAAAWLSEEARSAFAARAEWLELEARTLPDKIARARQLLVCSEIQATLGERERAQALAIEARDLAPSLALAHRQARALMPSPPDPDELLEALDAEIKMTAAGPARLHSMLVAIDVQQATGDEEGPAKRLDQAVRASGSDPRAALLRAVRALGRNEVTSAALRLPDNAPELAPVVEALGLALRLRGVERKEASSASPTPGEILLQARAQLDKGDVAGAVPWIMQLADVPELTGGAAWLASALAATTPARRADAVTWLRELVERGDAAARLVLLSRAVELGDREAIADAVHAPGPLASAERATLAALASIPMPAGDAHMEATEAMPGMRSLAAALAAVSPVSAGEDRAANVHARSRRTAGSPESRALVSLGRLLGASGPDDAIEAALAALGEPPSPTTRAVALEMATRAGRTLDVSCELEGWGAARGAGEERAAAAVAGAIVAERGGQKARAIEAFRAARATDPTNEASLRAIASLEQIDLVAELNQLADDLGDGMRGAMARIEAVARGEGVLPEPTRAEMLERAHRAAPTLPIAAFMAERLAHQTKDTDEVLRWIRERRATTADAVEAALDGVREAMLVADKEPAAAAERLHDAHRARPGDVALRELLEQISPEPLDDGAAWRERRAAEATGQARTLLLLDAAREYERAGDPEAALRCAQAAAATESAMGRIALERAELGAGNVARLADELLTAAKSTEDPRVRREAYERLAVLDATARQDPASALLWHRSILEEQPGYVPSLRYVEQHLIGEGRDEELEPIAAAVAQALHGKSAGEASAHAELAARLRLRGATGSWDATREMVDLAAAESPPSLWSLRMLEAHSRARGDDKTFLATTLKLLERTNRPVESAALLVHAGEAASRLGRLDEARSLLERAAVEDPGDVVAWGLLADVRQRSGDPKGAAEACESLARSSFVPEHQLLAWYDAGRIWQDEAQDDERALVALEAAAALEPAFEDTFDRLSKLYAVRRMQPELANLLERRLEKVTDPEERLAMEVRRGRILLEVGDVDGARSAFESALAQRPDDAAALSAFADLCVAQKDWDAAEQALVRLARLLPTPEEQRDVYSRLGELYSHHLLNLARAEVALKEVLKRAPDDAAVMDRLVDVYRRQNDPARAIELQQELVAKSNSPEEKRARQVALALIHEQSAHDNRKAEQTLEAARRESPQDVGVLRALADFYVRHQQTPAVNILLDRAGSDARRALATGRFSPQMFDMLATVWDLRGKKDAARVTQAMLAALEGRQGDLRGAAAGAFDPRLDDLLAPEVLSPAMRQLLRAAGDAMDAATPFDARGAKATPLPGDSPVGRIVATAAQATGMGSVQVLVTPKLGATCVPGGSNPPLLIVGEALAQHERLAGFLVLRALKMIQAHASALVRTPAAELPVLVSAWLKCFNPSWVPQGANVAAVNAMGAKVQAALPKNLGPDVGVVALEVAGNLGTQAATLGTNALHWGNRVTLLALGDATGLLDSIAVAQGLANGSPREPKDRATWISRTVEARDLLSFGVAEAFAEARARVGLDR